MHACKHTHTHTRTNTQNTVNNPACFEGANDSEKDPNAPKTPQTFLLDASDLIAARKAYMAGKADKELRTDIKLYKQGYVLA